MFVKKNGILYNLNIYAKVFPDKERLALCLADVQGDFDTVDFNNKRELEQAYDLIIKFFKMSNRKKNKEADNILDLDNNTEQSEDNIIPEQRIQDTESNPWSNPLEVNSDIPPIGVSREEWEESRRNNQNAWRDLYGENISLDNTQSINGINTFSNAQIDSRVTFSEPMREAIVDTVREDTTIINERINNLESTHNNMLEELTEIRVRNNLLESQIDELRHLIEVTNIRVTGEDELQYGENTWNL